MAKLFGKYLEKFFLMTAAALKSRVLRISRSPRFMLQTPLESPTHTSLSTVRFDNDGLQENNKLLLMSR